MIWYINKSFYCYSIRFWIALAFFTFLTFYNTPPPPSSYYLISGCLPPYLPCLFLNLCLHISILSLYVPSHPFPIKLHHSHIHKISSWCQNIVIIFRAYFHQTVILSDSANNHLLTFCFFLAWCFSRFRACSQQ